MSDSRGSDVEPITMANIFLQDMHEKMHNMIEYSLAEYAKQMIWDADGQIIPPITVTSTDQREELRKHLFGG